MYIIVPHNTGSLYFLTGSAWQWKCPLGTRAVDPVAQDGLRVSSDINCRICPAKYYGNHTERLECTICPPGYYCPRGMHICISVYLYVISVA